MSEFSNVFSMEAYRARHCFLKEIVYFDVLGGLETPEATQDDGTNQVAKLYEFIVPVEPDNLIA